MVKNIKAKGSLRLRLAIQLSLKVRIISGVSRLITNHPGLAIFESTPEVRVLPSAGVIRLQRSYDPVRLPPMPAACCDVEAATLTTNGSPPITRTTFLTCRAHYPGGSNGCTVDYFPAGAAFPQ